MTSENVFDMEEIKSKISPRKIILGVLVILIIVLLASSFFVVGQEEEGVILRFGQYNRTVSPGLHFKFPFGIEQNYNVPVKRILTEEFGFRTEQPGVTTRYSSRDYSQESLMLTGDLNIIDVNWTIQYRIVDPKAWLFNVNQRRKTIRDISQSVINLLVGDRTIFDVIGGERTNIQDKGKIMMNDFFNLYQLGIDVKNVKLLTIVPPKDRVQDAFEDVNRAIQDRNRLINEGKEAYNQAIPKVRGEANKIVQQSEGYAAEKVNRAKGDVARFKAVYQEYRKDPRMTRVRIYYELFGEIFKNKENVEIIDKELKNFLPLKSLNKKGDDQ
jgi:membrane protease subunit HflK